MKSTHIILTTIAGVVALTGNLAAQGTDEPAEPLPPDVPPFVGQIHDLRRGFLEQRRSTLGNFMEERRALREQLADANEEQRRQLIAEFRQLNRERIAAERELRREFRRQMRELQRERRAAAAQGE